jgi:hypothetical protein
MDGYFFLSLLVSVPIMILFYNIGSRWAAEAEMSNPVMWGILSAFFTVIPLAYLYNRKTAVYNARELAEAEEKGYTPVLKRNFLPYIIMGVVLLGATARFID